ncbi:site-specific tyrosine recombinase/integron integrase [Lachnospiraceae bacterium 38-14]
MDVRDNIIKKVMGALVKVGQEVSDIVQDTLIMVLNDYEIQERCTEVAVLDTAPESMLKKFIATKRLEGIAESTLTRYYDANLKLLQFLRKDLSEITTYDIRFYLSYRRECSERQVSNRTLDGMRRCYSSFFSWLDAEEIIPHNPCAGIKQIKYKKDVKKPFSAVDIEKMRNACSSNIRDLALIDFLYCTGCRVSEVARLNISDINFEALECVVIGKGNKERYVYLSEVAAMHLREYLDSRQDDYEALFAGKGTERLQKNGIEAIVKNIGKKAGVDNAHPHRFRRTLATNLLDRGMNIQDVAEILGHADLKTTQIYCYISKKNVKAAYCKYAA